MRDGLQDRASAEDKLRTLFQLGCTPLGVMIDVDAMSLPQLRSLWNAIVALCNARANDLESVELVACTFVEHMRALGYEVSGEQQIALLEPRSSRRVLETTNA